ncbi:MAG TPA: hypothetical protein VNS19_18145 [Acidimicrobiales bacterium]|nr:hypothetical protein [Acidimicrobiales bacterium]
MDTTWIAPPAVLGIGAAAVAMVLRAIAKATDEAEAAHRRFRRLEDGLIPLRVETRRTRESVDRMHRR